MKVLLKEFLEISAIGTLMILIVIALRVFALKKMNPNIIMAFWVMILVRLCIPFTFSSPMNFFDMIPEHSIIKQAEDELTNKHEQLQEYLLDYMNEISGTAMSTDNSQTNNQINNRTENLKTPATQLNINELPFEGYVDKFIKRMSIWSVLTIFWILGITFVLLFTIRKAVLFKRKLLFCKPVVDKDISQIMDNYQKKIGIKRKISVLECNYVQSPVVFGYVRPSILLPTKFINDMDKNYLSYILLHEICHVKRHDMFFNYVWLLAKAVHWFNPLVWIGYKMFQDDIELCCDHMSISYLNNKEKLLDYSEAIIIAARFSTNTQHRIPGVVTTFYRSKSKLKDRVFRLIKPQKKSRILTAIAILLVIPMLITGFTTACYPVSMKSMGEGSKLRDINTEKYITIKCRDSFYGADRNVKVIINADVVIPDKDVPVIEVKPYPITMEQIKSMAEVFFKNNTVYEPQLIMTKAQIKEKITEYEKAINNETELLKGYNGNQDAVDKLKENYRERITQYEKMYATAPDSVTLRRTDWQFHPQLYYMNKIEAEAELKLGYHKGSTSEVAEELYAKDTFQAVSVVDGYHAMLEVYTEGTGGVTFSMGSNIEGNYAWWNSLKDSKPMKMTKEEAVAMVYDVLKAIGITNMRLSDCRTYGKPKPTIIPSVPGLSKEQAALVLAAGERPPVQEPEEGEDIYCYSMTFVPDYGGVAVYGGIDAYDMTPFYERSDRHNPYYNDSILINVNNGIITYFSWSGPMEQISVDNCNIASLSLKDAVKILKKNIQQEYTIDKLSPYKPEQQEHEEFIASIESGEIYITDIRLGYMPISINEQPGVYRMEPAWIFLGTEELNFIADSSKNFTNNFENLRLKEHDPVKLFPYAIISAVDGSIIYMSGQ